MDIASLGGLVIGVVMVVFGIVSSGGVSALGNFVDIPSVIITIGGSLSSTLASNKIPDFIGGLKSIVLTIKGGVADPGETIKQIIDLSNVGRKEGLLALEEAANGIEDQFLKKGIMLVVDGTDAELVRGILETDLVCLESRHKTVIGFWEKWAEMGPAWGMIGTLVGLVNMLKNLEDASTIGPNMAVALLTTLYGSLIANWLCSPTAAKLKVNNDLEVTQKTIAIEGLLSIQAGENPRVIEEKLKSFLAPSQREGVGADAGGEE
ncbi:MULTISPECIES: motility protein A [Agathobacter]|uniref:Motility protein A n=1 Tax=Agathobacter ruminis TaxID=1712665 RepID=A0A2G3E3G9_9FIRM|nr:MULTISPECIES: motility protein A [Agathobacter]MBQ1682236.1 motility protein A [Agathobacter sp.]MCR5676495.1 motility protein A [Agathobacter sp.]MDC7302636.1 motility protein A [Agathobacter ruminis]PHU37804.1 motility protein A [Agathobacter ruminis]